MAGQERFYNATRKHPERVRKLLLRMAQKGLGPDYDLDPDFTPTYDPWDQRVCLVPNGDLFKAIRTGTASVVTDHIDRFTEHGILLESGTEWRTHTSPSLPARAPGWQDGGRSWQDAREGLPPLPSAQTLWGVDSSNGRLGFFLVQSQRR